MTLAVGLPKQAGYPSLMCFIVCVYMHDRVIQWVGLPIKLTQYRSQERAVTVPGIGMCQSRTPSPRSSGEESRALG